MNYTLTKGTRLRAEWFEANPNTAIAGMQPKVGATHRVVIGTVHHIRGDHPTNPTAYRIWVQPDEGGEEVIVDPKHVKEILE